MTNAIALAKMLKLSAGKGVPLSVTRSSGKRVANHPAGPGNTIERHPRVTHVNTVTATNRINQQKRALILHNNR